jgi:hypothetical protein
MIGLLLRPWASRQLQLANELETRSRIAWENRACAAERTRDLAWSQISNQNRVIQEQSTTIAALRSQLADAEVLQERLEQSVVAGRHELAREMRLRAMHADRCETAAALDDADRDKALENGS